MDIVKGFMESAGVIFGEIPAELEAEEPESVIIHEWDGGGSDEAQ